ncbi:amino acid permease [Gordonia phosphorivorans]|uniref:Amino acid permease n=1 Tax=Gordonia phosphorivorans TaxID=1056982 RepID=A0ABV6H551_9ACTN
MDNPFKRIKSVEQSIADTDEPDTKLRRELTAWDLTVFGVAVVVGAGIFTLTARTAGNVAGPSVSLAFLIAAVACGLAALCYAEFASTVPVAGSAYTFSFAAFGEFAAWIIGWDLFLELALAASVVSLGWSAYLGNILGTPATVHLFGPVDFNWGAALLIAVLTTLLALGTKLSSRVSVVITALKVAVVLLVIIAGAFYIDTDNYTPYVPEAVPPADSDSSVWTQSLLSAATGAEGSNFGWYGLLAAASLVFFAFLGFDIVATTAEETKNPQKALPRGILGSLAIVTVLYVAVTLVVTGMVPYTDLADKTDPNTGEVIGSTLTTAFNAHHVTWVEWIINLGALAGLTTVVMVMLLGQSRVGFAMARDGLLPRGLAKTSRRGTPARFTVLVGVSAGILAAFFPMGTLEEMVNIGTLFAFILVSIGVLVLRRTRPDLPRGFRVPLMPLIPILSVLACLWLMINLSVETWLRFLVWMLLGLIIYFGYGYHRSVYAERARAEQRAAAQRVTG